MEVCTLLSAIFSYLFIENAKSTWWAFAILDLQILIFFVAWPSFKPKFVSSHRFSAKSDYLSLRYGDKTIISKPMPTPPLSSPVTFFKLWPVSVFPGYTGCKGPKVKGNLCAYLPSQDKAATSFRKMLRQYVKSSGRHLEHLW